MRSHRRWLVLGPSFLIAAGPGLLARAADRSAAATARSGVDPDGFDRAVRPQDDFFRHVNGGWIGRQGRFLLPWGLRPVPPTSRGGTCLAAVRRRQARPMSKSRMRSEIMKKIRIKIRKRRERKRPATF